MERFALRWRIGRALSLSDFTAVIPSRAAWERYRNPDPPPPPPVPPTILSRCADCGFGVVTGGELFMVEDKLFALAWTAPWTSQLKFWRGMPGQMVLCVGCFEQRIGRTLMRPDFANAPINLEDAHRSERLRDRLTATKGSADLIKWATGGMIADRLPKDDLANWKRVQRAALTGALVHADNWREFRARHCDARARDSPN